MGWQFDRVAFDGGAWWQVLTAQWVHWGWMHATANALGAVVLLLAFRGLVDGRLQWAALPGGVARATMGSESMVVGEGKADEEICD